MKQDKITPEMVAQHHSTFKNRKQIEASEKCGCFFCGTIFTPSDIKEWCDGGATPICPYCGIDSVICDGNGVEVTPELLAEMRETFF